MPNNVYLVHHGILGQKWGQRNGPPYPLGGGDYTVTEQRKIKAAQKKPNSIYNKKHYDEVLKAGKTTLSTLSYDKDRTKNVDMFYATHKALDKQQYNALFNRKLPSTVYDDNGNSLGTGAGYKFRIDNKLAKDVKVASEDSGIKVFQSLYSSNRDFYNFVTDSKRMESLFVSDKYKFKGYRESKKVLDKLKDPDYKPTDKDIGTIYRMFNYVIPSDGGGNQRAAKDVQTQRAKFFDALKKAGYGAVLDTNDAIYGGFKATSPVIVFDMENVIPDRIRETTLRSKQFSSAVTAGRKALGI